MSHSLHSCLKAEFLVFLHQHWDHVWLHNYTLPLLIFPVFHDSQSLLMHCKDMWQTKYLNYSPTYPPNQDRNALQGSASLHHSERKSPAQFCVRILFLLELTNPQLARSVFQDSSSLMPKESKPDCSDSGSSLQKPLLVTLTWIPAVAPILAKGYSGTPSHSVVS